MSELVFTPAGQDGASTLLGRAFVSAHDCWYPPAVATEDVLRVDFDRRAIGQSGLYLVETTADDGRAWRACRHFTHAPLTGVIHMDRSGVGDWVEVSSLEALHWRVVGYVEQVYKPAH